MGELRVSRDPKTDDVTTFDGSVWDFWIEKISEIKPNKELYSSEETFSIMIKFIKYYQNVYKKHKFNGIAFNIQNLFQSLNLQKV